MPGSVDFALAATIASITSELITRKIRVAGRIQDYDSMKGLLSIRDGETEDKLLVDISLCLSPFKTYPWLQEQNTTVMAIGYLEEYDGYQRVDESPAMILRAILLKECTELDLVSWAKAVKCDKIRRVSPQA